jgi:aryl-alcohol dehydrogenase-like predicted oxidoreductase
MKTRRLGRSDIFVSELCLGTMTWGSQNSEAEGHAQMDRAFDAGVNFLDTAEMYPTTPRSKETVGRTEEIVGTWLARPGNRARAVVATKITGAGSREVRDGAPITAATFREALEGSLKRLRTDTIDLYQLHWANRGSYHFRQSWHFDPTGQRRAETLANMLEVLEEAGRAVKAGKIRLFGLSNETVWGTMQYLRLADEHGLPRCASVQNEYNLLNRFADTDFAEMSHHEDVGLLPFSPLAAGLLTGKYMDGAVPAGSRKSMQADLYGRDNPVSRAAVAEYVEVARRHGLDPAQMALAFCRTRPFIASTIIGATSMEQLENDLKAGELELSKDVLDDIAKVHRRYPQAM